MFSLRVYVLLLFSDTWGSYHSPKMLRHWLSVSLCLSCGRHVDLFTVYIAFTHCYLGLVLAHHDPGDGWTYMSKL